MANKTQEVKQKEEVKEAKPILIGKFKPKKKFISFVTGYRGNIRMMHDHAVIQGDKLSGLLEGSSFKMTICDEGTINFEEVNGTHKSTDEMLQRIIDDICERDTTGYMEKFVVSGYQFFDDDKHPVYLEVEQEKPIDRLRSILHDGEDQSLSEKIIAKAKSISEKGKSILDDLGIFGDSEDEKESAAIIDKSTENKTPIASDFMKEAFDKMQKEKIDELKSRAEKLQNEIKKYNTDINHYQSKMKESVKNLDTLNARLDTFLPPESSNGWMFFISEEQKTGIEPDEKTVEIIKKLSPVLGLIPEKAVEFLTKGFYEILISDKDKSTDEKTVIEKIFSMDIVGKFSPSKDKDGDILKIEYRGDLNWHQLVDKMVRKGFIQDTQFDKSCHSNSYESKELGKLDKTKKSLFSK